MLGQRGRPAAVLSARWSPPTHRQFYLVQLGATVLEFEYKKVAPAGKLVVKQVRRLPEADNVPSVTPFLIDQAVEYCSFQGEYGDALGNHRLKSRWTIHTRNFWLTPENLQQGT